MISPIYFAHGYREREARFNEYFGLLIQKAGLLPSIDPPSETVNSAKLERHLKFTSGLIAVLSFRTGGYSQHIIHEIRMCLMSGKPALVFIEDNLPDNILPGSILQKRFSTRSFAREVYEHLNTLDIYKNYIGTSPRPQFKIESRQKSCLLLGFNNATNNITFEISTDLIARGFKIENPTIPNELPLSQYQHTALLHLDLVIIVSDNMDSKTSYMFGAVKSNQIPTIEFTTQSNFIPIVAIPYEYQKIKLDITNEEDCIAIIKEQIELYEEDFVALDKQKQMGEYIEALSNAFPMKGDYNRTLRTNILNKITFGDDIQGIINSTIANKSNVSSSFNKNDKKET